MGNGDPYGARSGGRCGSGEPVAVGTSRNGCTQSSPPSPGVGVGKHRGPASKGRSFTPLGLLLPAVASPSPPFPSEAAKLKVASGFK